VNDEHLAKKEFVKPIPLAVNVEQAAAMVGVCTKTLRREIARGDLASVRIGSAIRIRTAEIEAYLRRKEKRAHPLN
jgi:excisionase family DNA binding protein